MKSISPALQSPFGFRLANQRAYNYIRLDEMQTRLAVVVLLEIATHHIKNRGIVVR
jgi:hypothetical protein